MVGQITTQISSRSTYAESPCDGRSLRICAIDSYGGCLLCDKSRVIVIVITQIPPAKRRLGGAIGVRRTFFGRGESK